MCQQDAGEPRMWLWYMTVFNLLKMTFWVRCLVGLLSTVPFIEACASKMLANPECGYGI